MKNRYGVRLNKYTHGPSNKSERRHGRMQSILESGINHIIHDMRNLPYQEVEKKVVRFYVRYSPSSLLSATSLFAERRLALDWVLRQDSC